MIGGSSIGAAVASQFGMEWTLEQRISRLEDFTVDNGSLLDVTFPAAGLVRGARMTRRLRQAWLEIAEVGYRHAAEVLASWKPPR